LHAAYRDAIAAARTLRASGRASCSLQRTTQQRPKTAAGHHSEKVDDDSEQGQRRPRAKTEERHRYRVEVLGRENEDGGDEQPDDDEVDPAHGGGLSVSG